MSKRKRNDNLATILTGMIFLIISGIVTTIATIANNVSSFVDSNGETMISSSLYILLAFIVIGVIYLIWLYQHTKKVNQVKNKSLLFNKLDDLNLQYTYQKIKTNYNYSDFHSTKSKFDRDNPIKFAERHIYQNIDYYNSLIDSITFNKTKYNEYLSNYNVLSDQIGLSDMLDTTFSERTFLKIETKLYKKHKQVRPITNTDIKYQISYTSPKGRNHYENHKVVNAENIKRMLERINKDIEHKKTRQYKIKEERSKMSSSLRYNILKRDKYRCQICGSQQSDGVKLHIDHIVPVSKGGKTVSSNLQTLCDRCNMGKSNKV